MTSPARTLATAALVATVTVRGHVKALRAERDLRRRLFAPPPVLTVSQWADRFRMLSSVASAEPGRWRTDRAPYQREILDAISEPRIPRVVVMSSTQVGKTEIINNACGFYIDQDPAPILVVQPTLDMARTWSTDRLAPMLKETPRLSGKVRSSDRRHSEDTILHKVFPGGHLTVVGANSASGLASRPIRVLLLDEVDRYPPSAGSEGDPVSLARKRTHNFWNRKEVEVSSPTIKGASRIEADFLGGDQRYYLVPCPHCGHRQRLEWARLDFETVSMRCESCAALIEEGEKPRMLREGGWVAMNPGAPYASFHLNALYSPWATWAELIAEFHAARQSPETLQVFVNTVLAETWEIGGEEMANATELGARRVAFDAEVPDTVGILTAGADVQKDRVEVLVLGWGEGQQVWTVKHERIYGDPEQPEVWERVDAMLNREWKHACGGLLRIRAACVDSGSFTAAVYRFVQRRQRRGVFATKGSSQRGRPLIGRPSRPNKYRVRVVPIGTDTAKDVLFARLKLRTPPGGHPPPGFVHFRDTIDDEFLAQLGAEVVRIRRHRGIPLREYHQIRDRNEAIDLFVENFAALHLLGSAVFDQLGLWVDRARATKAPLEPGSEGEEPPPTPPGEVAPILPPPAPRGPRPPRMPGRGWVSRW